MPARGQAQQVEGPRADEQGEGRVEPAGEAEDDALHARVLEAPGEAGGLDREDLAAALVERRGVGGDERVRVDRPHEAVGLRARDRGERHAPVGRAGRRGRRRRTRSAARARRAAARCRRRSRPARRRGGSARPRRGGRRSRRPAGGRRRRGRSWTRGRRRWRRRRRRACGPTAGAPARGGTRPWPRGRSRPRGSGATVAPATAWRELGRDRRPEVLADLDRERHRRARSGSWNRRSVPKGAAWPARRTSPSRASRAEENQRSS